MLCLGTPPAVRYTAPRRIDRVLRPLKVSPKAGTPQKRRCLATPSPAAPRSGTRLRHMHDVLQGAGDGGIRQAAGRVVPARRIRKGLQYLSGATGIVPGVLLPVDAGRELRPGMEAREGKVRGLCPAQRRQSPGRGRPELSEFVEPAALGG